MCRSGRLNFCKVRSLKVKANITISPRAEVINRDQSLPSVRIRDDAFSDNIQRTDSASSGGPHHDERASSRNDHQPHCEHTPERRFGAALGRLVKTPVSEYIM